MSKAKSVRKSVLKEQKEFRRRLEGIPRRVLSERRKTYNYLKMMAEQHQREWLKNEKQRLMEAAEKTALIEELKQQFNENLVNPEDLGITNEEGIITGDKYLETLNTNTDDNNA